MTGLSAIVPATNAPPTLDRCTEALRLSLGPNDEMVIVDSPRDANAARARNLGAAQAAGDVLVFVDSDVEVRPEALGLIRAAFDSDRDLVALFGSYDDQPMAPGVVSSFRNLLHHYVHQCSPGEATTFWTGLGAVRRDAFEELGGFDESIPFMEDIDFGMRLASRHARIILEPEVQGTHLKAWTLWGMVRTDFAQRGIPWVRLLLRHRHSSDALNLSWRHRLSAGASLALLGGVALRRPRAVLASGLLLTALNREFYALLARRRGRTEATAGVFLHAIHHLAGVASVPVGAAMYLHAERVRANGERVRVNEERVRVNGERPGVNGQRARVGDEIGAMVRCVQTGVVRPKHGERGVGRYARDRWSAETLPVNCYLIERADGLVLFDTGQTALTATPGYLPRWHPFLRLARFELGPEDEAAAQLVALGHEPRDVRMVVLSHLHTDHVGGLAAFTDAEVVVTRLEWERATGLGGRLRGYLPGYWPSGVRLRIVEFGTVPVGPFTGFVDLGGDSELLLVPLAGHTHGHAGLLVRDERGPRWLLAGDAAHTAAELSAASPEVGEWARANGVTILTAHDSAAASLVGREVPRANLGPAHIVGTARTFERIASS